MTADDSRRPICEVHADLKQDLRDIQQVQKDRDCGEHSNRLQTLEKSDVEQWDAINDLRRTVWKGVGVLMAAGFFGSIVGTIITHMIWKH